MKKIIGIIIVMLFLFNIATQVSACTGFTASDENNVLVGINEDWYTKDFNARFFPPENGKYGKFILEYHWPLPWNSNHYTPIIGLNDQGLFVDSFSTPYLEIINNGRKLPIFLDDHYKVELRSYCLSTCSTVQEVIDIYSDYNLKIASVENTQHFYVDRYGDSVIIEGDEIIYKEGDFQVVCNFLQSHPDLPTGPTAFLRYDTAVSMLENMTELTVEYFRDISNATHLDETDTPTILSTICDLKNGNIYLYHFHDYENVIMIDLEEELEKGEQVWYDVPKQFEPQENQPPNKPNPPVGEISGDIKTEYTYYVEETTDPDNNEDEIYYMIDWGDGTYGKWLNRYFFEWGFMTHIWSKQGNYEVRVKAKDIYDAESEWSDPLEISMPKSKSINLFNPWLFRLTQRFPILEILK
jgi:hypothetical protein